MDNKRIVITGIDGFVGSCLRRIIIARFPKAQIFGIDKLPVSNIHENERLDLLDLAAVNKFLYNTQPDFIFHLAGVIDSQDWHALYEGNVQPTIHLIEASRERCPGCRIVIPGSAAEYGDVSEPDLPISENNLPNPVTPYGFSKLWQTTVARYYASKGSNLVIGRMFNLIGNGVSEKLVLGAIVNQLNKIRTLQASTKIMVGNIKTKRDFLDLTDACNGLLALAVSGRVGEIYNICSGESVSIEQIIGIIIELSGIHADIEIDQKRIKNNDIENSYGDNQKIMKETKWRREVALDKSIKDMLWGI